MTQVTAKQDLKVLKGSRNEATHILRNILQRLTLLSLATIDQRKNGGNGDNRLNKVEEKDNK